MTTDPFPTAAQLAEIEADPEMGDIKPLVQWCRNLLADREEAIRRVEIARRARQNAELQLRDARAALRGDQ